MKSNNTQISTSRNPISWIPTVYFAMGLPFITLSLVSVVMFKDLGVDNQQIAFWTSLLILPWSLKPIFSLVMETFGTPRKYIIIAEIFSALMFGLIVFALPLPGFFAIVLSLMAVVALSGSMHDIAGDGIYLAELDVKTQSKFSGWQGAFYNMAKVLANGGLVFLSGWLISAHKMSVVQSWQIIFALLGIILFAIALYHLKVLPAGKPKENTGSFKEKGRELREIFISFFKKKHILYYLIFIFLYRFSEGLSMKIVPLLLKESMTLGGLGLNNEQYGLVYGTFGTISFIIGSIAAGYYVSSLGLKKALFSLALLFNVPNVVYLIFAIYQPADLWFIATGIVFEYFGYGFGFVGLILFMMQQIAPGKHQMAHYAFANSLMNLGVMVPGILSGFLINWLGYKEFFIVVMIAIVPALLITWFVPFTYNHSEKEGKSA